MKTRKLSPRKMIVLFLAGLALFVNMACIGGVGDAMDLSCAADPNSSECGSW